MAKASGGEQRANPYVPYAPPKGAVPANAMATDYNPFDAVGQYAGAYLQGLIAEGMGFLGYPYLAELTQRAEYRRGAEILAKEMTRKWIKITYSGEKDATEKVQQLEDGMSLHRLQDKFRRIAELDNFFGRAHLRIDNGRDRTNLTSALPYMSAKFEKDGKLSFKVVEPFWCYPGQYETMNPLADDFYVPKVWYVNGQTVDASRLLTFVSREMPDILKPAYSFGGLALSQIAKPYIDNWLRARQSASDLLHSFSTPVLKTNMEAVLGGGVGAAVASFFGRLRMFNDTRDNRGIMAIDKDTEEFLNVTTPLSGVDKLVAQAQEQMASVYGIPLVILLGITPSGLNASSDGEVRTFYAWVKSQQEQFFRPHLTTCLEILQLNLFGAVDPGFSFQFHDLWETSELDVSTVRKNEADTDAVYVNAGVVAPEEIRTRLAGNDTSPYHGLEGPAPEPPEQEVQDDKDDEPSAED
ncbi:MAG: DUF1073 domain-containing protein [Caulobacteraceae bacterium]